jgi:hypothetical protein
MTLLATVGGAYPANTYLGVYSGHYSYFTVEWGATT